MTAVKIDRRTFLALGAAGGAALALAKRFPRLARADVPAFEHEEATVDDLQKKMAAGGLTARALTQAYLDRIAALDRAGPMLRSVIETNPEALAIADALDAERKAKGARGPLHGIPILLKDNIDTADKNTTTAGSLALQGSIAARDSTVAARLRAAGAILLGKANMSEWANARSNHSSSGWSARGGQCRNPYALDRNPCGSSSGSAVAVSASLCALAVGTETDGSIVCPASTDGVVGIKPTVGLVSRAGIIPISHTQDTAGPLCRTVRDAALLLGALIGADPRDPASVAAGTRGLGDYTKTLDPDGLRGARIGVHRKAFGFNAGVDKVMEEALAEMKRRGAVLVDPAVIPHSEEYGDSEGDVLLYEIKADLNAYLAALGPNAPVKSLADIIAFNEAHRAEEMAFFGQEQFEKAQAKGPLTDAKYLKALAKCKRLAGPEGVDAIMAKHKLDAVVAPTGGPGWLTDHICGDFFAGGSSSPAAVSGYPAVSVVAGMVAGLPVGITFMGRAYSEPTLLKLAYAFEQATHHRRPPRFLPTAALPG